MIEAHVRYTLENYREFFWFGLFRGKYYRYKRILFPFLIAFFVFYGVYAFLYIEDPGFLVACIAVLLVCCAAMYVMALVMPKRYVTRAPAMFQGEITFRFEEEHLAYAQTGEIADGEGTLSYDALYRVYETTKAFYIYISPQQAYILDKSFIPQGDRERLRAFLQGKLPPKTYIVCK